jgi:hypothetical protein
MWWRYQCGRFRFRRLELEFVGILGHRETRNGLARAFSNHLNAKNGSVFLAGRAKNGESRQCFAIKAGDEKSLFAARLFPNLAYLYLGNRHF